MSSAIREHRNDIDGLRGLAVLAVVLFHFEVPYVSGGFVGVDIFFVISGFLITKLVQNGLANQTFTFQNFYIRRVKRLFPALVVTVIFSLFGAIICFTPEDLINFARSVPATVFGFSNVHFWRDAGYFDSSAMTKPLLHTWSLSIEEQFYLIWPAIIFLFKKKVKSEFLFLVFCCLLFAVCLALNVIFLGSIKNTSYFLTPMRAYEFLVGAGLIFIPSEKVKINQIATNVLALVALCIILYCEIYFSKATSFPGYAALLPCVGAAVLIFTSDSFINKKLLSCGFLAFIGMISYSFYLFHWPIYVFFKYVLLNLSIWSQLLGIAVSMMLATVSYYFVENTFRNRNYKYWPLSKKIFICVAGIGLGLILVSKFIIRNQALFSFENESKQFQVARELQLNEFYKKALRSQCWLETEQEFKKIFENNCIPKDGKVENLVFGDSHSAHLYPGLMDQFPDQSFSLMAFDSCDFSLEIRQTRKNCQLIFDLIKKMDLGAVRNIIIATRSGRVEDIKNIFIEISKKSSANLYYVGPVPFYNNLRMDTVVLSRFTYISKIFPNLSIGNSFQSLIDPLQFEMDRQYQNELKLIGVKYLSPLSYFCPDEKKCNHYTNDGYPILIDQSHMTVQASKELIHFLKMNGKLVLK